MKTETRHILFTPCAAKGCESCVGVYFDKDGRRIVCSCWHHRQGVLLPEMAVKSKQGSLF